MTEKHKTIEIPVLDDGRWNPTLEFTVKLADPRNCELGRFLFVARVKVIDTDVFPTNRFAEQIKTYGPENLREAGIPATDLLLEYAKLNLTYDNLNWKSFATIAIDQLENLYLLLSTYIIEYVADDVLGSNPHRPLLVENNRDETLLAAVALYIIPNGILNILALWQAELGIAQTARSKLQENIMTKYMNYT